MCTNRFDGKVSEQKAINNVVTTPAVVIDQINCHDKFNLAMPISLPKKKLLPANTKKQFVRTLSLHSKMAVMLQELILLVSSGVIYPHQLMLLTS